MGSWTPAAAEEPSASASAGPLARPDEASARATARAAGKRVEITSDRTETDQDVRQP
jgi:hypothetical protein